MSDRRTRKQRRATKAILKLGTSGDPSEPSLAVDSCGSARGPRRAEPRRACAASALWAEFGLQNGLPINSQQTERADNG